MNNLALKKIHLHFISNLLCYNSFFSSRRIIRKEYILIILIFFSITAKAQFFTQNLGLTDLNPFPNDLGIYTPATSNRPPSTNYGTILGLRYWAGQGGSDWRTQLVFTTEKDFYFRQSNNTAGTVWSEWFKIYHSGNLNNSTSDFNANRLIAKELTINNNGIKVLLSASGNSYINSGNFGIGNMDPQNKLDVNGTIHSKEVKVDMIGWSDYVFKKDYVLPTLDEVEKHINENGHLQNIPSEKEVLKNGVNLGEMNAKLLEKIEELTLYIIDLNKKIKQQDEKLEEISQKTKIKK
ncbi:pyocin knob domain-containing protein [Flavobacterium sp. Fl-318]|uniref:Pyocin knob domain-containing protein n=1 Tax=Flavobacterium cupriresistens TaxID=2893885 RepID=A0ABU4RFR3_9FLAO|nr:MULTISPECIES: pyocin knob domain-containing protein [unclassified Flavobacterium]MDX6191111.1 pyocin knob domain-containing protein [Flavobacterium sp. Fl-318]UFH42568.1 pyocin knob domain-containing protein [Flavobacterium sp. F-323]